METEFGYNPEPETPEVETIEDPEFSGDDEGTHRFRRALADMCEHGEMAEEGLDYILQHEAEFFQMVENSAVGGMLAWRLSRIFPSGDQEFDKRFLDLLDDHIESFKKISLRDSYSDNSNGLKVLSLIYSRCYPYGQAEAYWFIKDNFDFFLSKYLKEDLYEPVLFEIAPDEQRKQLIDFLLSKAKDDSVFALEAIDKLIGSEFPKAKQAGSEIAFDLLEGYGLNPNPFLSYWSAERQEFLKNLNLLHDLAEVNKEIPKFLFKKLGIIHFARYGKSFLEDQFYNYDETDQPFGVIIMPYADHNGAFNNTLWLTDLNVDAMEKCQLRLFECKSGVDVFRHLLQLEKLYNGKHKISFAIIGGHGSKDSIDLGEGNTYNKIWTEDLAGKGVGRTSSFFEEQPTIILKSCDTGQEGGIAQKLAQRLGAKVIGPSVPTNLRSIKFKAENGKFELEPIYKVGLDNEDPYQAYVGGKKIDGKG